MMTKHVFIAKRCGVRNMPNGYNSNKLAADNHLNLCKLIGGCVLKKSFNFILIMYVCRCRPQCDQ